MTAPLRLAAIVVARNEDERIASTVAALRSIGLGSDVVVVDDASADATARRARDAGARVLRTPRRMGKGGAMEGAIRRLPHADVYLFADGDLGDTARNLLPVVRQVARGEADLAVAVFPRPPTGGFGLVKGLARRLVRRMAGFEPREPLSGQRAITSQCLAACRPLAPGFGVEMAMTTDAARMGFRVAEVPVDLEHRFTRRDLPGFVHRGRQGWDALRAAIPRFLALR